MLQPVLRTDAFKDHELVGLDDIQARLSNEQRDTYVVNQRGLSLLMMGSVLGALLVSVMIFAVKVTVEGVRLRREALSSKARRLRYKSSHVEVSVPEVDHGHYHTFLSHVWGTGQDQMRIIKQRLLEMMPTLSVFLDVDDLDEIGDLEGYIRRTSTVLVCAFATPVIALLTPSLPLAVAPTKTAPPPPNLCQQIAQRATSLQRIA